MMEIGVQTILTIIGSVGGLEAIKWFFDRKKNNVEWLENRVSDRDRKIDSIYIELRGEQAAHLNTLKKLHVLELEFKEATYNKCDLYDCKKREPPRGSALKKEEKE